MGPTAYLVNDPRSTAYTMLFCKLNSARSISLFSTPEKAPEWLGNPKILS